MIERFEIEFSDRRDTAANLAAIVLPANRRIVMRKVWNRGLNCTRFCIHLVMLGLRRILLVAQSPAFFLARLALGRILGLADGFAVLVRLPVQVLDKLQLLPPRRFQLDQSIDIALYAATGVVLLDAIGIFNDEFTIQHFMSMCVRYLFASSFHRCALALIPR